MFLRPLTTSTTLQEVGILPTLVLFPPFGLILGGSLCKCPKGLFGLEIKSGLLKACLVGFNGQFKGLFGRFYC